MGLVAPYPVRTFSENCHTEDLAFHESEATRDYLKRTTLWGGCAVSKI